VRSRQVICHLSHLIPSQMSTWQLRTCSTHDSVTGAEKLGAAVLADDDEAVAFAKRVIRELIQRDAKLYATWTMEVTAGRRSVASVPFESDAMEDAAGKM
jgi:hypothetical protein